MRSALIVGINYYEHMAPLFGCVNDALAVRDALEFNDDPARSKNFQCLTLTGSRSEESVTRDSLKDHVENLFRSKSEIALFYFAGHGHIESTGGYLLGSDSKRGDQGVSLSEILYLANQSPSRNQVIILDSCHSGIMGSAKDLGDVATLSEGLTILTASTADQYANEENCMGVFTSLLVDALLGGAASLTGDVTPGSVYAHIDQSLAWHKQRPVFKTHVESFVSLRKAAAAISAEDLRKLTKLFPDPEYIFPLDPTYEGEVLGRYEGAPAPIQENVEKFKILQKYNRVNLLVPVDVENMWNAAMESTGCRLTRLGQHYHRLVKEGIE